VSKYYIGCYGESSVCVVYRVEQINWNYDKIIIDLQKCNIPVENILFYFVYFIYAASIVRNGWVHLPDEQTGRPDHLTFT